MNAEELKKQYQDAMSALQEDTPAVTKLTEYCARANAAYVFASAYAQRKPTSKMARRYVETAATARQRFGAMLSASGEYGQADAPAKKGLPKGCIAYRQDRVVESMSFEQVVGMTREKQRFLETFVTPVTTPMLTRTGNRGLLLYGPPGTGKTYLIPAAVHELGKRMGGLECVVLFSADATAFLSKDVGGTERKVRQFFRCVRDTMWDMQKSMRPLPTSAGARASETDHRPPQEDKERRVVAVVYMDEVDSLASKRTGASQSSSVNLVNTLLAELDGITQAEPTRRAELRKMLEETYPLTEESLGDVYWDVPHELKLKIGKQPLTDDEMQYIWKTLYGTDPLVQEYVELSHLTSDMFLIANTNRIEDIDPAFLRRLQSNVMYVGMPSAAEIAKQLLFEHERAAVKEDSKGHTVIHDIAEKLAEQHASRSDVRAFFGSALRAIAQQELEGVSLSERTDSREMQSFTWEKVMDHVDRFSSTLGDTEFKQYERLGKQYDPVYGLSMKSRSE